MSHGGLSLPATALRRRIATRRRRIESGVLEFKFDVPDSIHANVYSFLTQPPRLLLLGRAGTVGAEVRAVAEGNADADTAQRLGA